MFIYGIINTRTNHLLYVGKTRHLRSRMTAHRSNMLRGEVGPFAIEVLEETTRAESCDAEVFWIKHFQWLGCNLRNKYWFAYRGGSRHSREKGTS